jgi:hypothetical protein
MYKERKGSLDPAGVLKVSSDKERYDKRQKQIFKVADKEENSRCTISGGCSPDVVVEVRASKSVYGTFGFDWLRVGDSDASTVESDKAYNENVGYHYYKDKDNRGREIDVRCTDDSQINGGTAIFKVDSAKQNLLSGKFKTLTKIRRNDNLDTPLKNEEEGKSLKDTFHYKVPVITLMPKDINKNPSSINLKAVLDTMVYLGKNKPDAIVLEFDTNDRAIFESAMTLNKENIPMSNKKDFIVIESKGTLVKDITINIVALKKQNAGFSKHPCGAFTILRNNGVKDIKVVYIGTKVNAELDEDGDSLDAKEKEPPTIDEKALRSTLGQALVNIKTITRKDALGHPLMIDMTNKLSWITLNIPNDEYNPWKHEKFLPDPNDPSKMIPNPYYDHKIYDEFFPNPEYTEKKFKDNPKKYPKLIKNKNYKKVPPKRVDQKGLDFDNLLDKLELEYYNTYLSSSSIPISESDIHFEHPVGSGHWFKGRFNSIYHDAFVDNTFRCYFLADHALSRRWKIDSDGGGAPGEARSMFFGDSGSDIGVLAHELGHNLGLKHTFTQNADIVYKFSSTDNFMDYSYTKMVFYHWQWKQMNSRGIT